jgi:hypothetical protein
MINLEVGKHYIRTYEAPGMQFFDVFTLHEKLEDSKIYTNELIRIYDDRVCAFINTEVSTNTVGQVFRELTPEEIETTQHLVDGHIQNNTYSVVNGTNDSTQSIKYTDEEEPLVENKSILLQADKIVNGDRNDQYGDPNVAFGEYKQILSTTFGIELTEAEICKVMMAIKLGRMKYKYKEDSLIDLCGYTEILNRLEK